MQPRAPEASSRLPPGAKLLGTLAFIFAVSILPAPVSWVYLVPALILAALALACRLSPRFAWRRMLVAEFFILGIGFLSLFSPGAGAVFLAAFVKSNLCVFALLLLTWTTPFSEILAALKGIGVPSLMLTTLALMVRYLPVLASETRRMERARASRSFHARHSLAWRNLAAIVSQLFLRSSRRAERIYLAMCARGWK